MIFNVFSLQIIFKKDSRHVFRCMLYYSHGKINYSFKGLKLHHKPVTSIALRCHPCGMDWEEAENMQSLLNDFMEAAIGVLMPSG